MPAPLCSLLLSLALSAATDSLPGMSDSAAPGGGSVEWEIPRKAADSALPLGRWGTVRWSGGFRRVGDGLVAIGTLHRTGSGKGRAGSGVAVEAQVVPPGSKGEADSFVVRPLRLVVGPFESLPVGGGTVRAVAGARFLLVGDTARLDLVEESGFRWPSGRRGSRRTIPEGIARSGNPWIWSDGRRFRTLLGLELDTAVRAVFDTAQAEVISTGKGITFAVDPVEAVRSRLPRMSREQRRRALAPVDNVAGSEWMAGSAENPRLVPTGGHAFAETFVQAWNEHRPVRLSPDAVWMVLLETLVHRVDADSAGCRSDMVRHARGRETLMAWLPPEFAERQTRASTWPPVVAQLLDSMDRHAKGGRNRAVLPRFSTTTPDRAMAARIRVLELYRSYFDYEGAVLCGIPSVTLEGTAEDWRQIRRKLSSLDACGLRSWTTRMGTVLDQFVAAAEGRPDRGFWRSFVRFTLPREDCGASPVLDGWITLFFPPVGERTGGEVPAAPRSLEYGQLPADHGEVRFKVVNVGPGGTEYALVGGFSGVAQAEDGSLSPELGWAVWRRR